MAGTFAHICLVNSACTPEGLNTIPTLIPSVRAALENYQPFCRLGAVSPDCPALVGQDCATGWSNIMHYVQPADFVRYAIPKLVGLSFSNADTRACIAWLFGYTAHLVTDYTIHPIVEKRVGPYSIKKNRAPHRLCEFDQDVHIFHKLTGKEVVETDFLQFSGLAECGVKGSIQKLNRPVAELWKYCLQQYPRSDTKPFVRLPSMSLTLDNWFATYLNLMKNFATKPKSIAHFWGMTYRRYDKVDSSYIEDLATPRPSQKIHYDDLFETAQRNIIAAWTELANALDQEDRKLFKLPNGNLDTGRDENGKSIYWS